MRNEFVDRSNMEMAMTHTCATILASLPDLPQVRCIRHAAEALGSRPDIRAFWLGGSFARGNADLFSDIDMRIVVARDDLGAWQEPDLAECLGDTVVGQQTLQFDDAVFLHHLVLGKGTIVDFYVQSTDHPISPDAHLILKCEDTALGERIRHATVPERQDLPEVNPQDLKAAIEEFWIGSHKHAKVLFRDLDLLALVGIEIERALLMRLWHAELTGKDLGKRRPTIHLLTPAIRTIQERLGPKALCHLGAALDTRKGTLNWIAVTRDEVNTVGKRLAAKHGFIYPEQLENTVRQSWAACEHLLKDHGTSNKTDTGQL